MATMAEQVRTHNGPIILGYGSQPFFLFGAVRGLCNRLESLVLDEGEQLQRRP
jgi:hypothetical protein